MNSSSPLILHTEASTGWGGQEIRVLEELREMQKLGFQVALVTPGHGEIYRRALAEKIPVYHVRFGSKFHLPSWGTLFSLMASLKPAVVNTHSSDDSWLGGMVAKLMRVPLIIRTRHVSTPVGSILSYKLFPDVILTTSQAIKKDFINHGLKGEDIHTVSTGIRIDRFSFSESARQKVRNRYQIEEEEIVVGNACVFRSWKGLDFLVDTAAALPPSYKFMLVGDGPTYRLLKKQVQDLNLGDRVIFTGHQEAVEEYLSALDLFFFTSFASEGVSQSFLQAMAVGLPIVSSSIPSAVETLAGFHDYAIVDYGDISAASQAILEMDTSPRDDSARLQERTARVKARYSIETMLYLLLEVYQKNGIPNPQVNNA